MILQILVLQEKFRNSQECETAAQRYKQESLFRFEVEPLSLPEIGGASVVESIPTVSY